MSHVYNSGTPSGCVAVHTIPGTIRCLGYRVRNHYIVYSVRGRTVHLIYDKTKLWIVCCELMAVYVLS